MRFKCSACGRAMIIQGKVQVGDSITCPFCGQETIHGAAASAASAAAPVPPISASAQQTAASGLGIPAQMPQMQAVPPLPPKKSKKRRGNGGGNGIVLLLVVLLAAGAAFWGYREFIAKEEPMDDVVQSASPEKGNVNAKGETSSPQGKSDGKEAQKSEIDAKAEQERLARQKEREERARKLESELAEKKREAAKKQALREAFQRVANAFANKPGYFAVSAKKDDVEDPRKGGKDLTFWAVGKSFHESGVVYVIKTEADGLASVSAVTEAAPAREIGVEDFEKSLDSGVWAIASAEAVWFFNTGKQARTVEIPDSGNDLYPLGDELVDVLPAVTAFKIQLPEVRYRLTLKPKKDGDDKIPLGIIQGSERVSLDSIRKVIRERLVERKTAKERSKLKPPKAKKFKRTVVFTDDAVGRKTVDGVTHVPRTFRYKYRHWNELNAADEKWRNLCEEAERQDERARAISAENYAAKQAYERKLAELEKGVAVSALEIKDEMNKYRLLIERSRTKVED